MEQSKDAFKIELEVPLPSKRLAEIVYHVLRVDTEPKRSGVSKTIYHKSNVLHVKFSGHQARQLRVAVNSFFETIHLVTETIEFAGEPLSSTYSHF